MTEWRQSTKDGRIVVVGKRLGHGAVIAHCLTEKDAVQIIREHNSHEELLKICKAVYLDKYSRMPNDRITLMIKKAFKLADEDIDCPYP